MPLLDMRGIVKRFGAFTANDQVSLTVGGHQIHALLGENGAGKSTLVKMLVGLLVPDEGDILWHGKLVRIDSPEAAQALGIAMVFQHFSLFDNMTVLENIALGLHGKSADTELSREAAECAERYGLRLDLGAEVWRLSAGERQRIEIVRCLMQKPKLLVLDEPTSVLTPQEVDGLFETLQKLRADGASILFISHKLDEVRRLCSAATILRNGKRVAHCDPHTTSSRELAKLMVGEEVDDVRKPAKHSVAPGDPVAEIIDLTGVGDGQHAMTLRGVNLSIKAGEIVGIAGIAGSGQSELFAVLSGEGPRPAAGRITLLGQDVTSLGILQRRDLGAAFVPEERLGHATLPRASLSENLVLSLPRSDVAGLAGMIDHTKLDDKLAAVTRQFDVRASTADPEARRLSGGNLQKYVIGREILRNPAFIVVNQPTWGVDAAAARNIRQALIDLAGRGAGVLVISQDLDEVFSLADRIAVIHGGELTVARLASGLTREHVGLLMTGAGLSHAA